jgi:hypothetical protein
MPFTPAHALAAWPIARLAPRLPLAAVVIGTWSPDFEYLLRLAPTGRFGHSLPALFWFCVPLSLAVWVVFDRLIRPALSDLLGPALVGQPAEGQRATTTRTAARRLAWLALAAAGGALSHVIWDSFTHDTGWAVARIPFLASPVGWHATGQMRWYKLLQHGSTVLGGVLLVGWMAHAISRVPAGDRRFTPERRARALRALAVLVLMSSAAALLNSLRAPSRNLAPMLGYAAVGWLVGVAAGLLMVGLIFAAKPRRPLYL